VSAERDLRPEARRAGARRGGRYEQGAEAEELVCLDDDRIPGAALLVAAHASGCGESEDLAADHVNPREVARARRAARARAASPRDRARRRRGCAPRLGPPSAAADVPPPHGVPCGRPPSRTRHRRGRCQAPPRRRRRVGRGATVPPAKRSTNCATYALPSSPLEEPAMLRRSTRRTARATRARRHPEATRGRAKERSPRSRPSPGRARRSLVDRARLRQLIRVD
jgi:hypothetical protein